MSAIKIDDQSVSRRAALASLGAGALGLALTGAARPIAAQDDPSESLQSEDDVVYGTVGGVELLLNVLRPADRPELRPAVVVVHGGGLVQGTRWDHGEAAIGLAQAGYATFSIEYRLYVSGDPTTLWPAQLDDVQRAVRWVRANADAYGVDPERVGAFGYSSGGQLAAFLGTRDTRDNSDPALAAYSSKATCVVAMGGLFDFTFPNAHPDSRGDRRGNSWWVGGGAAGAGSVRGLLADHLCRRNECAVFDPPGRQRGRDPVRASATDGCRAAGGRGPGLVWLVPGHCSRFLVQLGSGSAGDAGLPWAAPAPRAVVPPWPAGRRAAGRGSTGVAETTVFGILQPSFLRVGSPRDPTPDDPHRSNPGVHSSRQGSLT